MKYISTRGGGEPVDFLHAALTGLAPDGGLFVPVDYPSLAPAKPADAYVDTATRVLSAFAGGAMEEGVIRGFAERAYGAFAHRSVAPLTQVGQGRWMLELHHGPTLAFKDVAMRLIAQLYDHVLGERGERMTILCATSGDTGGAAASAFAGSKNVDIVILHPLDRISPVQRRFMTATGASNVHNLALAGDFDGTQAILKDLFVDSQLRVRAGLAAVNSINWVRVAAQSIYFAQAQAQLGVEAKLRFVVPTGNFGDALAGYIAHRCGLLPTFDCITAVNENDAMVQLLSHGRLTRGAAHTTPSPAMDIQAPSNFERLLFDATGRNGAAVAQFYDAFRETGEAALPAVARDKIAAIGMKAEKVSNAETFEEMRRTYAETGWIVCPHTAVGLAVARRQEMEGDGIVTLATAHAAKFPEAVEEALGLPMPLPARAAPFVEKPEIFDRGPMDAGFVRDRIDAIVRARA